MKVNTLEATENIITAMKAKLVTMLSGDPGLGKSAIIHQIARRFNLHVIDVRLSQCDPTDLNGFPSLDTTRNIAKYVPMDIFPTVHTKLPEDKNGFLLFLDEFNSASLAVQAASYKLILDKQVGQEKLHSKCVIVCAGNLSTNNAIVNRLSTAMQSRLVHNNLIADHETWLKWANTKAIDHRITAYIGYKPNNLHNFKPDHNDVTFACPRTWEFTSRLLAKDSRPITKMMSLLSGTIGEAVAHEFITFTDIYTHLPTFADIMKDTKGIQIPQEPSMLYAISNMVAAYVNKNNIDKTMEFITRLPIEFETITLQNTIQRNEDLLQEQCIREWATTKGMELYI